MTFFLAQESPVDQCTVDVTPRRCQHFKASPGERLPWSNTSVADGRVIQSGTALVDRYGLITLEQVAVSKDKNRISITHP
jgi:hypothetical protein